MSDQLDIFTILEGKPSADGTSHRDAIPAPTAQPAEPPPFPSRNSQITELAGETWEDAFGRPEAA